MKTELTQRDIVTVRKESLAILGGGTMGCALLDGLCALGMPRRHITVVEPSSAQRRYITRTYGVRVHAALVRRVCQATIIVLSMKPQQITAALEELEPWLQRQLVVSIVAGVTTQTMQGIIGQQPIVRAMPNMAARVQQAIVALCRGRYATAAHLRRAHRLFRALGITLTVRESQMDAVTAVSGSGPAYYFWLTEQLAAAGAALGLPKHVAAQLARQTAIGSGALLAATHIPAARLCAQVTSKRGTTAAALKTLARAGAATKIRAAVRAAARRSRELAQ